MPNDEDNLFERPFAGVGDFRFDEKVSEVFPDMIRRSVPGYGHVIGLSGLIAKRYAIPNTVIYDLGCSLGATTIVIANELTTPGCRIVAVDNSEAMLNRARATNNDRLVSPQPIEWLCRDITDMSFEACSIVVLNFTLQFIAIEKREELLTNIKNSLVPGGLVILAEKVLHHDTKSQQSLTDLHHDFKRANGYSELEIAGKRQAIENVLVPETSSAHEARLARAGFSEITQFFHCINFKAWIAVK
ncbi:MAG TPA: carboxy-S-adenosyl-L-methionine synthase CmoA [Gammaproteobacteria bacterium]|nr:carboxy-S-adenosyl-L-methionine synthase CmoA [Gammaproteobacteria bacterium]